MQFDEIYQRERVADFVRQAEHDRLVESVKPRRRKSVSKAVRTAVGVKLVELGTRLQDNVETVKPPQLAQAKGT